MKVLGALFIYVFVLTATAQEPTECKENYARFEEALVQGSYNDATAVLTFLREKCPKYNERIYIKGEEVLKFNIESSQKPEERQKLIDDLFLLYSQYDKNFPGNSNAGNIKKAMVLKQYGLADDDEVFRQLDTAFKTNSKAFTDYSAIEAYFMMYLKNYETGKGAITPEQFIDKYSQISGQALLAKNSVAAKRDALLKKQETQILTSDERNFLDNAPVTLESLEAVSDNINLLASKHFSCARLEEYFSKQFSDNKENATWLEAVTTLLYNNKCYNSPVLLQTAQALNTIAPTGQTAFYLGTLAQRKGNLNEAVGYFQQAVDRETTAEMKSGLYYAMGSMLLGTDKAKSKDFLIRSAGLNPKSGKPYLLLAEMYSSVSKECGLSPFEQKALSWLAVETLKKAEKAEPKYKPTVVVMAEKLGKRIPTKQEAKEAGKKKGDTITFGCWINETITIPNL